DFDLSIEVVLLLTLLAWTAYQFFSPAESAALAAIAQPHQIASATSLLHALSLVAQLLGAGAVAPLAVDLLGLNSLFIIVMVLMVISGTLYAVIPGLTARNDTRQRRTNWIASLPQGFRTIAAD